MSTFIHKNGKHYRKNSDNTETEVTLKDNGYFYWTLPDGKRVREKADVVPLKKSEPSILSKYIILPIVSTLKESIEHGKDVSRHTTGITPVLASSFNGAVRTVSAPITNLISKVPGSEKLGDYLDFSRLSNFNPNSDFMRLHRPLSEFFDYNYARDHNDYATIEYLDLLGNTLGIRGLNKIQRTTAPIVSRVSRAIDEGAIRTSTKLGASPQLVTASPYIVKGAVATPLVLGITDNLGLTNTGFNESPTVNMAGAIGMSGIIGPDGKPIQGELAKLVPKKRRPRIPSVERVVYKPKERPQLNINPNSVQEYYGKPIKFVEMDLNYIADLKRLIAESNGYGDLLPTVNSNGYYFVSGGVNDGFQGVPNFDNGTALMLRLMESLVSRHDVGYTMGHSFYKALSESTRLKLEPILKAIWKKGREPIDPMHTPGERAFSVVTEILSRLSTEYYKRNGHYPNPQELKSFINSLTDLLLITVLNKIHGGYWKDDLINEVGQMLALRTALNYKFGGKLNGILNNKKGR